MKQLTGLPALIMLFLGAGTAGAHVYYVANAGSDDHSGLSVAVPLRTLARCATLIAPGDTILLRRGDVFRESVRIETRNIELNAYGPAGDPLPVVSGAVLVSGWKPHGDHIHVAEVDAEIGYLFVDQRHMTIARYPNQGWLRTKSWEELGTSRRVRGAQLREPNTVIQCDDLAGTRWPEDYWVGATVRWRHHSWWYETRSVVAYDRATGKLSLDDRSFERQGPSRNERKGWGFYIDHKLDELDVPGEWYFDPARKQVYLYPPAGSDLDAITVEGSALSRGLSIIDSTVQNICFRHYTDVGLEIDGRSVVEHCLFEGIGRDAKVSEGSAGGAALRARPSVTAARVSYNTFRNNFNNGIVWNQDRETTHSSIIEHNVVENSGVFPGYGGSGSWHGVAILVSTGRHVHVQYNRITGSGYAGILFGTEGNFAEYNVIRNAMATMNDGGGIYTNCSRSVIRHNIILDTKGGMESSGDWPNIAHGIWPEFLRDYKEQVIEDNTCAGSGADGIFLPNNFDSIVRRNVCYNNERYQLLVMGSHRDDVAAVEHNHLIADNILYAAKPTQYVLYFDPRNDYGVFKDNYFIKPSGAEMIQSGKSWPGMGRHQSYTVGQWQAQFSWADQTPMTGPGIHGAAADNSELFYNDTEQTKTIALAGTYIDLDGRPVGDSIVLAPYTSSVLIRRP